MFEYMLMFVALCVFGRFGRRKSNTIVQPAYLVIREQPDVIHTRFTSS